MHIFEDAGHPFLWVRRSLYRGAGFCDVEVPDMAMSHARVNAASLVEEFLASLPMFQRFAVPEVESVLPGDLLGFRLPRTIHHLGVCFRPGVFVHAIEHLGTTQSALADPTWGRRLAAKWCPIEP